MTSDDEGEEGGQKNYDIIFEQPLIQQYVFADPSYTSNIPNNKDKNKKTTKETTTKTATTKTTTTKTTTTKTTTTRGEEEDKG